MMLVLLMLLLLLLLFFVVVAFCCCCCDGFGLLVQTDHITNKNEFIAGHLSVRPISLFMEPLHLLSVVVVVVVVEMAIALVSSVPTRYNKKSTYVIFDADLVRLGVGGVVISHVSVIRVKTAFRGCNDHGPGKEEEEEQTGQTQTHGRCQNRVAVPKVKRGRTKHIHHHNFQIYITNISSKYIPYCP